MLSKQVPQKQSHQLKKAQLIYLRDDGSPTDKIIEFMFNPNQLAFSRSIALEQAKGSRTDEGNNKTSFKHPNPYSLKISNILIDTYEAGTSVLKEIEKFKKTVEFTQDEKEKAAKKRPPIFIFAWGEQNYLRCFVKTFSFKLTLFRPDGTPVRATIDLDLEQVEIPNPKRSQSTPSPSNGLRQAASRETFL